MHTITLEEFKNLLPGEKIIVMVNGKKEVAIVEEPAFYNCDADEPDWEVNTNMGFVCIDSVYIEELK